MIELVVNGVPYTDFVDANVTVSIESLSNDFSFTASAVKIFPPFKLGDEITASVDGEKKLTGSIEEVSGNDQEGGHTVTYSGRDKTGDIIDSSINVIDEIRPEGTLTLKRIIEIVLEHIGSTVKVIDNVNPEIFNLAEDKINPQPGQTVLEFIMPLARKRQVLLTSDGDGNIVITQSSPIDSNSVLQSLRGADSNNILSQSWEINGKQLFNKFIHRGQLDPSALNFAGASDIATVENQGAGITLSDIRIGRQRVIVESESYSDEQLKNRAKWSVQLAKARATRFSCSTKGHRNSNNDLYTENTLIQVNSDVADITRKMLINTITFSQGEGSPTTSSLELVERDVYTINEQLLNLKSTGEQNEAFSPLG